MIIKKGKFYKNYTFLYIIPGLKIYGSVFAKHYANIFKLAVGIDDVSSNIDKPALYILIDSTVNKDAFINSMEWFRKQSFYIADYPFDDIHNGYQHMLVISIPERVYSHFINSEYSKMYSAEEINKFGFQPIIRKVLSKDKYYADVFIKNLNAAWDTKYTIETWHGELDYPWKDEKERFNY